MKYIKHPIPEEISDKGGASVQLVQKQTIPLDGAIDDAIEAHYAIGQKEFIRNGVIGTMKSMAAGVRRDGRPRSIEGFLTVFPVFKGPVDLEKGFDPAVNKVQIKARLLNELELDISNWTFEDVTPGKRSFKLDSVKAGAVLNVVEIGEAIAVNGQEMPSTKADEELRVHWEVEGTDKSGDIPAAKMTSDVGRADIAADALAELASSAYDGKTIVFTVRGNFSSAKIAAKLKYVAPPVEPPTLTPGSFDTELVTGTEWSCDGTHLKGCKVHLVARDEETEEILHDKTLVESHAGSDTHFAITVTNADVAEFESGTVVELTFTNSAGEVHAGLMLDKRE